jgi:hypothetical protein
MLLSLDSYCSGTAETARSPANQIHPLNILHEFLVSPRPANFPANHTLLDVTAGDACDGNVSDHDAGRCSDPHTPKNMALYSQG